jgi:DnaJ-class molecular chaperone
MKMKPCLECKGSKVIADYGCYGFGTAFETAFLQSFSDALESGGDTTIEFDESSFLPPCPICEGTGTIPDEPVSHCQGCGEPIELGLEWCQMHKPAADLWQALQEEA